MIAIQEMSILDLITFTMPLEQDKMEMVWKTCAICEVEFEVPKNRAHLIQTCGNKVCGYALQEKNKIKPDNSLNKEMNCTRSKYIILGWHVVPPWTEEDYDFQVGALPPFFQDSVKLGYIPSGYMVRERRSTRVLEVKGCSLVPVHQ